MVSSTNHSSSLITPDLRSLSQSFFTGENWFFYWKASASLWSSKLEQYSGPSPLFIPFLWSHHVTRVSSSSGYGAQVVVDFGQKRQDANLIELFELAKSLHREAVLVIPLGPLPFVSSGGMPSWLCDAVAEDKNGMPKVTIDEQNRIHKSYSFYSSKVFKEYLQTLSVLADLIRSKGIQIKVYGLSSYYQDPTDFKIQSFFEDYSKVAQQAFARYFATVKNPDQHLAEESKVSDKDWTYFQKDMKSLYTNALEETFAGFYQGELSVLFAQTSPWQPLTSLQLTSSPESLLDSIKVGWQNSMIPSLILSQHKNFSSSTDVHKLYQATTPHDWLPALIDSEDKSILNQVFNKPLHLLNLLGDSQLIKESGLTKILDSTYHGTWQLLKHYSEHELETWEEAKSLFLFELPTPPKYNHSNSDPMVNLIIKTVMRGHQVAINRQALSKEQIRLFELFIHENQLKKVLIGHFCPLEFISIGQAGKLCFFNVSEVTQTTSDLRIAFWKQILRLFEVEFINWQMDESFESLWLYRSATTGDLYYEHIRRVILRNKTSEAKNITIPRDKKHILVKILDPNGVEVITKPQTIDLHFQAQGFVVLDFGLIGESL